MDTSLMSVKLTLDQKSFPFTGESISIGRAADNVLSLPEETRIEAHHVVLRCLHNRWLIEGVDATTIQIANGRPANFGWLNSGDQIRLTPEGPNLLFETLSPVPTLCSPVSIPAIAAPSATDSAPRISSAIKQSTPATSTDVTRVGIAATVCLLGLLLIVGIWRLNTSPVDAASENLAQTEFLSAPSPETLDSSPAPIITPPRSTPTPSRLDPRDLLVLIGIGNLQAEARPHLLGVGWLTGPKTAVVGRELGQALSGILKMAKEENEPLQTCVIQGIPLEIESIEHPSACPEISLLQLKDLAEWSVSLSAHWEPVTGTEIERMRARKEPLHYFSYTALPRSQHSGTHKLSLVAFDPEVIDFDSEPAQFLYEQRQHTFKSAAETPLERGGLILNEQGRILGMVALNARVIWTTELEPALPSIP